MRICIFGATGATGSHVLNLALSQGHDVAVLVRNPDALPATPNLRIVVGDAVDPHDVRRAVRGAEAVVSCLGVGGKGDGRPSRFVSSATTAQFLFDTAVSGAFVRQTPAISH